MSLLTSVNLGMLKYAHFKICVLSQVVHSSSHAMTVLTVKEMCSPVWAQLKNAALGVVYPFKLVQGYSIVLPKVDSCSCKKATRKSAETVGKGSGVKMGAYIVSIEKKETVYKLEACEIAFFANACFSCP